MKLKDTKELELSKMTDFVDFFTYPKLDLNLHELPVHRSSGPIRNYGKNLGDLCYENLPFHKRKHGGKWSSGVPHCSLL